MCVADERAISPDEYTTKEQLIKFHKKHGFDVSEDQDSILLKLNEMKEKT
jgi:hypothetical protein